MTFRRTLIALLMLPGLLAGQAAARGIPAVDLTLSGDASPELLADIRQALERMARRQPKDESSQFPAPDSGRIDLDQFWKVEQDVPYTLTEDSPRQRLSITYPFEGEPPYRTIVHFHGGDWQSGSRHSANSAPAYWAIYQGYALVDVGYRLSDEAQWPAQLQDAKAAIRFLRANADQYQLDVERMVVMGASAGGHLAQMLAATNGDPVSEAPRMGYGEASSEVQGVVSLSGISDITSMEPESQDAADQLMGYPAYQSDLALEASPMAQVDKDFPPILLVHGGTDQAVPFSQSAQMAIRVNAETGDPRASLNVLLNANHRQTISTSPEVMATILDFVDGLLFPEEGNPNRSAFYPGIQLTDDD